MHRRSALLLTLAVVVGILAGSNSVRSQGTDIVMPALPALEDFGAEEDDILLPPEDRAYAEAAARLAARFMAGSVGEDGLFRYEFDFLAGAWSENDNIVRQAGAVSALGTYLATLGRDSEVERAMQHVLRTLIDHSIAHGNGRLVSGDQTTAGAETGATALALHGEILYAAATGDMQFAEARAAWLSAILEHWDPVLGMRRTPVRHERSPYYDGETWLALATFADLFPNVDTVTSQMAGIDSALMEHYREHPNLSFFHWGALASRVRHLTTGDSKFIEFAAAQTNVFLTEMRPYIDPLRNTCYSVEGLASTWQLLADNSALAAFRADLRNRVLNEQHKNAALQIRPGQTEFHPAVGVILSSEDMPDFAGAYLNARHRPQTRIDTTQHCLNAWLQMLK